MKGGRAIQVKRDERDSDREYRVVDQLLTMHAALRDRYRRWALLLNTAQIGISLVLCGFAFVSDDVLERIGLEAALARMLFGFAAVVVLILAITEFRVDWRGTEARHDQAVGELGALKGRYRSAWERSPGEGEALGLKEEFERVMSVVPPIPERSFVRLKARHEFKRLWSVEVSDNPKAPAAVLWLKLRLEGVWAAVWARRV